MKVALSNVTSGTNTSAINDNFTIIQDALNNGVFWRSNPVGEPNQIVGTVLDANNNLIINAIIIPPQSPAGLPIGAIYNDGGVIKAVT